MNIKPKRSLEKIAGITKLTVIDASDVIVWEVTAEGLESEQHFGEFTEVKADKLKYTEEEDGAVKNTITGFFTDWEGDNITITQQLPWLIQKRYIAILTDARGRQWGVGTKDEPLKLTYELDAEGPAESQGVSFTLSNTSSNGKYKIITSID